MLLVLDEKHKADLALLRELDVAVLAEFCRIAISFIKNGPNKKLFTGAARTNDLRSSLTSPPFRNYFCLSTL
jgi:hypothetical protein